MALRFGRCVLDLDRWELRLDDELVALEPRTMKVLAKLIERPSVVVTKAELLDSVWGDRFVSEAALTTQIKELRKAVGDDGRAQEIIKTVHGHGYRFVATISEEEEEEEEPEPARRMGGVQPPPAVANPLVAVLPFEYLSGDDAFAHVADGLTSDVVTALAKHRWLRVVPRPTSSSYGGRADAVSELRSDLGVDYVVEGSVRVGAGRLRVAAALADSASSTYRWVERYDRRYDDLFDVLDEIIDVIVATVAPEVGYAERDRTIRRPRADLQAWDLCNLGVAHFFRFTADDNAEAQQLLSRARDLDPTFAEAHAWWAYAAVLGMTYWDTEPDDDLLDEALAAANDALAVDHHNAQFHMIRGRVQLARRDYASALAENERAVALNPTMASAFCGLGDSLCYEGRYDEAIEHFSRSVQLGAHDPQRWAFLSYGALALVFATRYEEAVEWSLQASAIPNCQYWTVAHRVVALTHLRRSDECAAAVRELLEQYPDFTVAFARRRLFFLKRPEQLACYLDGLTAAGIPAT